MSIRNITRALSFGALLLFGALACEGKGDAQAQSTRCDLCGMRVESESGWRAGGKNADGETLAFDTPKCLFRLHHERGGVREPWVIEYYSQARRPARELLFVLGTDLMGPMGRDLVPVAGQEAAERMKRDHGGDRILTFDDVTAEIAAALFRAD